MANLIFLAGLGFGDEGKGGTVDYLTRQHKSHLTVRYNGGAQAAHTVVLADGRHHTFSQFGSGTLAGAKTFLSEHMILNPIALLPEAQHLASLGVSSPLGQLIIDRDALITTPYHVAANRLLEMSRSNRHGSCGMGVGQTMQDWLQVGNNSLFVRDFGDYDTFIAKIKGVQKRMQDRINFLRSDLSALKSERVDAELAKLDGPHGAADLFGAFQEVMRKSSLVGPEFFDEALKKENTIIFEGAQGVLLDESFGFHPFTTWTDITFNNAYSLIEDYRKHSILRLGVLRAYATRHGAGPFVTEDASLKYAEPHNGNGDWQHGFRQGHFDLVMARYAIKALDGVDGLVVNHLDQITGPQKVCTGYTSTTNVSLTDLALPRDQVAQKRLTDYLAKAKPTYVTVGTNAYPLEEEFLCFLEENLTSPIALCSFGPTAADKVRMKMERSVA